jgi:hypothetical protein
VTTVNPARCFFDRVGQGKGESIADLDSEETWFCDTKDDTLFVYSTTDPDSLMVELLPRSQWTSCEVITLIHSDFITFEDLALYGGNFACLSLSGNCEGVEITDCELRYMVNKGINSPGHYTGLREDILIEDNTIDYMLESAEVDTTVEGNFPHAGTSDGIAFWKDAADVTIRGNFIKNFSHTAVQLRCLYDGSNGISDCVIESNEITAPDVVHGRGLSAHGVEGQVTGNVFRWNYVHDTRTRCQLNGNGNDYYANVIVDVSDDLLNITSSNGIGINTWPEVASGDTVTTVSHDNRIFNNTLVLAEYGGIRLGHSCDWYPALCDSTNYVYDNTIANNIIVDCGEYDDRYYHIEVYDSDGIFGNDFHNNCLHTSGVDTLILYKDVKYTVAGANAGTLDDDFSGNISADPDFDDYGNYDFHVPKTSPCYKEGTHLGTFYDYDGEVYQNPPTMGAFEWHKNQQGKAQASSLVDPRLACFPNPSGSGTSLRFTLPEAAVVRLAVHDVAGRLVTVLTDEKYEVGEYDVRWDGQNSSGRQLPSGVYFARLKTSTRPAVSTKVILLH